MNCPQCGKRMNGDWPDRSVWFNCSSCGERFLLQNGELVNVFDRYKKSGQKCANCGGSLSGGSHTAPWENGNNADGYTKCPHCGYANFNYDDD